MKQSGLLNPTPGRPDPKAQDTFDMFVAQGIKIANDESTVSKFIDMIVGAKNPVVPIADATITVIDRLQSSSDKQGKNIPMGHLAQVGNIVMGEIIEIAESAGLKPLSKEERSEAYALAVSKYLGTSVKSGKLPEETLIQMADTVHQTPAGQQVMQRVSGSPGQPGGGV